MCSSIHQQIKPSVLQLPHRISFLPLKETYKHVIFKRSNENKENNIKKNKELKTNILKEQKRRIEFQNK
jgi:hypothetical protein